MSEQRQPTPAPAPPHPHPSADKQAIDPPGARGVPGHDSSKDNDMDWLYGGPAVPPLPPAPVAKVWRQNRLTGEVQWKDAPPEPKAGEEPKTPREVFAGA